MLVKNLTKHDLQVTPADHRAFDVEAGAVVEVPDALGERLTEQVDNWAAVKAAPATTPAKPVKEGN